MSKSWDDREKALEDEYFHRKEQEQIERLRAMRSEREKQQQEEASALHCPKCDGTLKEVEFDGIQIDKCDKCGGVWLDADELESLKGKSEGWMSRMWQSLTD